VKGVERLCRAETSEKVRGTLVTVPLIRHGMGFSDQTAGVGSRYLACGDVPNVSEMTYEKKMSIRLWFRDGIVSFELVEKK